MKETAPRQLRHGVLICASHFTVVSHCSYSLRSQQHSHPGKLGPMRASSNNDRKIEALVSSSPRATKSRGVVEETKRVRKQGSRGRAGRLPSGSRSFGGFRELYPKEGAARCMPGKVHLTPLHSQTCTFVPCILPQDLVCVWLFLQWRCRLTGMVFSRRLPLHARLSTMRVAFFRSGISAFNVIQTQAAVQPGPGPQVGFVIDCGYAHYCGSALSTAPRVRRH